MANDFSKDLKVGGAKYKIYSLERAEEKGLSNIHRLPRSLKILLENLLRHQRDSSSQQQIQALNDWADKGKSETEILYRPARVIMQDLSGVPAIVDLAAMRDAMAEIGGDSKKINPLKAVDLVIDHSIQVEHYGDESALAKNVALEYQRNQERYRFLKWGQKSFKNFQVVPPGMGIVHQVNLEYLAQVVWREKNDGVCYAYPDTCVGTDSHTTMINGLSVLGWGVGGIEAEAVILNLPLTMLIPQVVGIKLSGELGEGVTATDLVLSVVEKLRKHGVVGKFVEFFGPGVAKLSLADRATLANMAPEYGATCGFFPVDEKTIQYLRLSGRDEDTIELVEAYAKEQGLWGDGPYAIFSSVVELDMSQVVPCVAGPKRPQDRVPLAEVAKAFNHSAVKEFSYSSDFLKEGYPVKIKGEEFILKHGHIVVAAITSCTNTSNPNVLVAAGLVAKKATNLGLRVPPWVKTSLAPGSKVVTDYLVDARLQEHLNALGFNLVGYGCTTCIGNTGPLQEEVSRCIENNNILAVSVLSGNRNFEGRISPQVKANYLASPPLVVVYALAGSMACNIFKDAIAVDRHGKEVFLSDLWPTQGEIEEVVKKHISRDSFRQQYNNIFQGDQLWQEVEAPRGEFFAWDENSTYIRRPPFFSDTKKKGADHPSLQVKGARILALLGDSVTTDHISPAGAIAPSGPAGEYLTGCGVERKDWNSFGSRRGNHEVMIRGTLANIRLKNLMLSGVEGGFTRHYPSGKEVTIYQAANTYQKEKVPLVIFAGKEYGTGSSRDWAAKGVALLGVVAVVAESFERIHRSNLVGMGVLPLQISTEVKSLELKGSEVISFYPLASKGGRSNKMMPKMNFVVEIKREKGRAIKIDALSRIDTLDEVKYFSAGGILNFVLQSLK